MSDADKRSTHIPAFSGTIEAVTGTLVVDTGLREVQSITASLAEDSVSDGAGVSIEPMAVVGGATVKATISVWAADGTTPSSTETNVGWMALGR